MSTILVLLQLLSNFTPAPKILAIGNLIEGIAKTEALKNSVILLKLVLVISIYLAEYLLHVFESIVLNRFSIVTNNKAEDTFYKKISRIKYSVLENDESNDLIFRVKEGIDSRFSSGFSKTLDMFGLIIRFASILSVVVATSPATGAVLLVVFLCLLPLYRKIGSDNYEAFAEANKEYRRARSFRMILNEKEFANEREMFSYGSFFNAKWKKHYNSAIDKELIAARKNHLMILAVTALTAILTTLLSGILVPSVVTGKILLGDFIVIVTQLFNLVHFMSWNYSYMVDDITENSLYYEDYKKFLALDEITMVQKDNAAIAGCESYEIKIENLSFKYPGCEDYVLKDFSYTFHSGNHYAIVGKNGAGKSTLVKLILGLYDEFEGSITINGVDVRTLSSKTLKSIFAVVFQDYSKYALPILDNILLDKKKDDAAIKQVEDALGQLGVMDEINHFDKGINTTLGKTDTDGIDLSGGQWQKIAIARGAVSDAGIVILDEPSSALDPISEKKLYSLYNNVFSDRTTIVITHRLGNTQSQDEIIVIDDGRVAESGDYQALMDKKALFYDMYTKQRGWYEEAYA